MSVRLPRPVITPALTDGTTAVHPAPMRLRGMLLLVLVGGCGSAPVADGGGGGGGGGGSAGGGGAAGTGTVGLGLTVEAAGVPIGYAVDFDPYSVTVFEPETRYLYRIDTATGFLAQLPSEVLPADFVSSQADCSTLFYSVPGNACANGGDELPMVMPVWPVDEDPLGVERPGGAVGLDSALQMREVVADTDRSGSSCTPRTTSSICVLATRPIAISTKFNLPIRIVP